MRFCISAMLAMGIVVLLLASGCADVKATQKVGDFGTAFGATAEEQKAIDWFKTTYGDPTTNNNDPARFVEPLVTTGLSDKNLPVDKVTTFPATGGSVYFFVIYDNFKKGDPITVSWVYLENGKEVTSVKQEAGGDFGRFIVEFQKPDSGWGKGKQRITVTGDGATANVDFAIGDSLETAPLPYNPTGQSAGTAAGVTTTQTTGTITLPTTIITTGTTGQPSSGGTTCTGGQTFCSGICVDLRTDSNNCGSCGTRCVSKDHATGTCEAGTCRLKCDKWYRNCDNNPSNGCETYIYNDPYNCGSCGYKVGSGYHCTAGATCWYENRHCSMWGGCTGGEEKCSQTSVTG